MEKTDYSKIDFSKLGSLEWHDYRLSVSLVSGCVSIRRFESPWVNVEFALFGDNGWVLTSPGAWCGLSYATIDSFRSQITDKVDAFIKEQARKISEPKTKLPDGGAWSRNSKGEICGLHADDWSCHVPDSERIRDLFRAAADYYDEVNGVEKREVAELGTITVDELGGWSYRQLFKLSTGKWHLTATRTVP